jgi:hypothetical protein
MIIINSGNQVEIPVNVATCPVCGGQLAVEITQEDNSTGYYVDCLETQAVNPTRKHYRCITSRELSEVQPVILQWLDEHVTIVADVDHNTSYHYCGVCGNELQLVRPGKYQCVHCE